MYEYLSAILSTERVLDLVRVTALFLVGLPLMNYLGRIGQGIVAKKFSAQQGMIVGKVIQYGGGTIVVVSAVHQLGFSLTPLLGAAGIVGIAVGCASQTSVSNVISGFFLIAEESFQVGDVVSIGDVTGFVLSVDILSVKIRTLVPESQ